MSRPAQAFLRLAPLLRMPPCTDHNLSYEYPIEAYFLTQCNKFKNKYIVVVTRSGAMDLHGGEASQWKKEGESPEAIETSTKGIGTCWCRRRRGISERGRRRTE
ncbi:hypothetical protein A2U01_0011761, partial [Trifolium medium]|nr:hypothetical protein [Trifolium medium]